MFATSRSRATSIASLSRATSAGVTETMIPLVITRKDGFASGASRLHEAPAHERLSFSRCSASLHRSRRDRRSSVAFAAEYPRSRA